MPCESELEKLQCKINRHFKHNSIYEILQSLENASYRGDDWATDTLSLLMAKSPTALKMILEQLKRREEKTIIESLNKELVGIVSNPQKSLCY